MAAPDCLLVRAKHALEQFQLLNNCTSMNQFADKRWSNQLIHGRIRASLLQTNSSQPVADEFTQWPFAKDHFVGSFTIPCLCVLLIGSLLRRRPGRTVMIPSKSKPKLVLPDSEKGTSATVDMEHLTEQLRVHVCGVTGVVSVLPRGGVPKRPCNLP